MHLIFFFCGIYWINLLFIYFFIHFHGCIYIGRQNSLYFVCICIETCNASIKSTNVHAYMCYDMVVHTSTGWMDMKEKHQEWIKIRSWAQTVIPLLFSSQSKFEYDIVCADLTKEDRLRFYLILIIKINT